MIIILFVINKFNDDKETLKVELKEKIKINELSLKKNQELQKSLDSMVIKLNIIQDSLSRVQTIHTKEYVYITRKQYGENGKDSIIEIQMTNKEAIEKYEETITRLNSEISVLKTKKDSSMTETMDISKKEQDYSKDSTYIHEKTIKNVNSFYFYAVPLTLNEERGYIMGYDRNIIGPIKLGGYVKHNGVIPGKNMSGGLRLGLEIDF